MWFKKFYLYKHRIFELSLHIYGYNLFAIFSCNSNRYIILKTRYTTVDGKCKASAKVDLRFLYLLKKSREKRGTLNNENIIKIHKYNTETRIQNYIYFQINSK